MFTRHPFIIALYRVTYLLAVNGGQTYPRPNLVLYCGSVNGGQTSSYIVDSVLPYWRLLDVAFIFILRCDIAFISSRLVSLCAYVLVMVYRAGGLTGSSLSIPRIEVRLAYILPSTDPINSSAIGGIILGMVVVVVVVVVVYSNTFYHDDVF
ncbi:hypothetical protein Hanom_Chr07g00638391 [Helianthus anomalus]